MPLRKGYFLSTLHYIESHGLIKLTFVDIHTVNRLFFSITQPLLLKVSICVDDFVVQDLGGLPDGGLIRI
jgi:hypothetical protein